MKAVKIKGFCINHSEIFTREGKSPSVQFPRILGIECVGEVVQSSTPALAVGQKVVFYYGREMGRAFDGSYTEYVLLPNEQIYPIHTDLETRNPTKATHLQAVGFDEVITSRWQTTNRPKPKTMTKFWNWSGWQLCVILSPTSTNTASSAIQGS